jgi:hypothetical protein
MSVPLTSERHEAASYEEAIELAYELEWSDGLPVVPPTERRVTEFLAAGRLDPDTVVADIAERNKKITAEKAAVNAVMAGCRPEYFPVLVAALEAMADKHYKFNHLASLGSPWPLLVVNGPIARQIGMHSGIYTFGPGHRANLTLARALSLVLRNCAGAKIEDVQRGQWGNSIRFCGFIAEIENSGWEPLHVQRGFAPDESAVTVNSTYPGSPAHVTVNLIGEKPSRMLDSVCHAISYWGGAQWTRGMYVLLISTHMVDIFLRRGWSKQDVRDYVVENTKATVADLKCRGAWGMFRGDADEEMLQINPGDEERLLYLFKRNAEDEYLFLGSATDDRDLDVMVVVAGGDAGPRMQITIPYQVSTNPVTKKIRAGK